MVQHVSGFQIEPGQFGIFDEEPVAGEPTDDALDEPIEETFEAPRVGRTDAMESRSVPFQRIYTVQNQHVQVDIEVQGAAETLDQGDDPGACAGAGGESCPMGQIGLDGPDDDCEAAAKRIGLAGEEQAQGPGEAQYPLTHRHFRNDVIDQMC